MEVPARAEAIPAAETAPTRSGKGRSGRRPLTPYGLSGLLPTVLGSAARAYTNWGLEAPRAYARREVEEYERQMEMGAAARGTGSSSGAGSSAIARAPLPPPKREEEEQREQQGAAPRAGRGYLPGDFVDDVDLDWVTAELMERTKDEPQQLEADREMKKKLYEYEYRQVIKESKADIPWGASDSDFDFDSDSDSG